MNIYILWYCWDQWQIHSVYRDKQEAEKTILREKSSKGPEQYMSYKIEERYAI